MMVARGREGRTRSCLKGTEFQFCKMKTGGWLHNNVNVLNTVLIKMVDVVYGLDFMFYMFCHNF